MSNNGTFSITNSSNLPLSVLSSFNLSDILGLEDALGDMDFKIAGDMEGITAFQLDIKVEGITIEVMQAALAQAKQGRLHILHKMSYQSILYKTCKK